MSNGGGGRNWRLVRADTDAVPSSVRRFMARARQRRLRAALPWAVGLGVLLVIGGLTWLIYGTPVLGVRDVKVVGVQLLTPQEVQQAAAVPADEPLARVDLDHVRARVRAIPAVDRVVVRRSWPSTLVVEVDPGQRLVGRHADRRPHLLGGEQLGPDHLHVAHAEHRRAVDHPGQAAQHEQHAESDRPGQRGAEPALPGPGHEPAHRGRHRVGVRPHQPPVAAAAPAAHRVSRPASRRRPR